MCEVFYFIVFLYLTSIIKVVINTNEDRLMLYLRQNMELRHDQKYSTLKLFYCKIEMFQYFRINEAIRELCLKIFREIESLISMGTVRKI